jgi:hypothetical protein
MQARGGFVQHFVADPVAERGVDAVEMVEVDVQHPHGLAAALGALDRLAQARLELAAVGQVGEGVGERIAGSLPSRRRNVRITLRRRG